MPDLSAILGLPYLLPSQAQKHVTHNEALQLLDILVQMRVAAIGAETPPAAPAEGEMHALGAAPTGAWAGQADRIAAFQNGAWRFLDPAPGWRAWDEGAGELRIWDGAAWVLPEARPETLPKLGINATADATNRLSLASDAALFSHDGAGHQLKINKADAGDTASLLFQSGFTGHAEMGLAGNTDFSIKVSDDGGAWLTALAFSATTGAAALPQGLTLGGGAARLDAYETGSWAPEAADAETGGAAASAATASGRYVRVGDMVFASFALEAIDTTGLGGGATLYIRGLPHPVRSHTASRFTAPARVNHVGFSQSPLLYLSSADTAIRLMQNVPGGTSAFLDVAALTSGSADIYGSVAYRT